MASGYFSTKTKRKDLDDDIYDDFSDFSLSSPARKIRRLDAEMEPIMEEEEEEPRKRVPLVFEQQQQQQVGGGGGGGSFGAVIEELEEEEELSSEAENEERAIVLFNPNPINTPPLFLSPSNFSLTLHSDIVSGFKTSNQFLWTSKNPNTLEEEEDENEVARQGLTTNNNGCLAVVPWMPTSQIAPTQVTEIPRAEISELMESESENDMGAATMDIEEESNAVTEFNGMSEGGIHQWRQKHCMIPQQIPHNTSTPIVWFQ